MSDLVLTTRTEPVAVLALNRPARHNSLVPEMLEDLLSSLQSVAGDPEIGAVVLAAEGRSFSTGGDVGAFFEAGDTVAEYARRIVGLLNETMLAMIDHPKPIVAAVHGLVCGGSMGLVLASDVVLVAEEASFAPWYPVVGFSPDGGWTALLPHIIGKGRATDLLMRNRTMSAREAVAWGLAASMVPATTIREDAIAVAVEISEMVPGAVRAIKAGLGFDRAAIAARLEAERHRFIDQIITPEARDGMASFLGRSG